MARRLTSSDEAALEELLMVDPVVNLFLLGFADEHPLSRWPWYGVPGWGGRLVAAALVVPDRLMVPFAPDERDAHRLGLRLRRHHVPCMMVGPRAACDAAWAAWAPRTQPARWHDQRLYVCDAPSSLPPIEGFRRATWDEWPKVAALSAAMQIEDMDVDPRERGQEHAKQVQERIRAGRTWVVEHAGELVYTVNVGTRGHLGCQIGGTYVPPRHRGRGIAKAATAAAVRELLKRHPRVTLHVNEANHPAVAVYERIGFVSHAAYRLATVQ